MKSLLQHRAWSLLLMLGTFSSQAIFAQSACPNADFSAQNFSVWEASYGTYDQPDLMGGIAGTRHTIFTAPGFDPFTCGGLPVLPPGASSSARLGNSNTGGEAERLRYGLFVEANNALFVYKYAVVLENPADHDPDEQPEFSVRLLDANGNPIGGACGTYTVYGGQPGQNFNTCGSVTWLPWTTVGMDLTAYMGQQVYIEFTTKDCSLGAHFGYAYISANCGPLTLQMDYCAGDQIISMEAPTGFQNYTWNPGNLTGQTINVPTPADGTVYTCTMSTFSNQGNCSVDVNVTVTPTIVNADFPPGSACVDNNLLFLDSSTVSSGVITNWIWSFGDGGSSNVQFPSHSYATGGTYTAQLIAISDQGCSDTITQEIEVRALPNVAFIYSGTCNSDTTSFVNASTDIYPLTYDWDFGDGNASTDVSPSHYYLNPANYNVTLTATSSVGCENSTTEITQIFPLPDVDAGPDMIICHYATLVLNATGASAYTWSNGMANGTSFSPVAGDLMVTGTDGNGCVNTDTMNVSFFTVSEVNAGPDIELCVNQPAVLNATGSINYNWLGGQQNNVAFVPPLGNTFYDVIGTDINGCSDTDQVAIIVHPLPIVDAGPAQVICQNSPVTLSGTGAVMYAWNNGVQNNTPFTPTTASFYTVTGTDQYGCINSDSTFVSFEQAPVLTGSFSVTNGCVPLQVQFVNNSGTNNTCVWSVSDGNSVSGCNTWYTFENDGCFDITLTSTSAIGCVYDTTFTSAVCTYPLPNAAFQPSPYFMLESSPVTNMNNSSTGAVEYSWYFGDGTGSLEFEPTHIYPEEVGTYEIILMATSDHGCIDTAMATVYVEEDLIYYVPNTFTPDGDGNNEVFRPVITSGMDPNYYHFYIYNRWGEAVFESQDIEDGWDGTVHGLVAQDGTYTWKIEFKSTVKRRVDNVVTGHVNILK